MRRILFAVILLSASAYQIAAAAERLAVLPLTGNGVDVSTLETVRMLLQSEIRQSQKYEVVPEGELLPLLRDQLCFEAGCAVRIGERVKAAKVVFGRLNRLGDKIIFQYTLVDVPSGESLVNDNLSAYQIEDLDQVAMRVAASIVNEVPASKTVKVGLVTEQESQVSRTRKANSSWGIGFGYLYPQHGYDNQDRVFVWDFRSVYEIRHFAVDAVLGIREGLALNIGLMYMPSLKDFTPYAGAGIGFHAVAHDEESHETDTHGDGFELILKGGLLAFRTYDFRVVANVEYTTAFNDYDDNAIILTIGVMRAGKRVFGIF